MISEIRRKILHIKTSDFRLLTSFWICSLFAACFLQFVTASPLHALEVPKPSGFVNDFAHVIQPVQAQRLEYLLTALEQQTGIEFAIVTLPFLEGESIEDFAVQIFEKWGIGKRKQDNGLLILAAIRDRKAHIEVGYGLEPIIPDAVAGRVSRDIIVPQFKKGSYGAGLLQGSMKFIGIIENAKKVDLPDQPQVKGQIHAKPKPVAGPLTWIFRILLLIGAIILFIKHPFLFLFLFSGFGRGSGFYGGGFGRGSGFRGFGGGLSGGGGASSSW